MRRVPIAAWGTGPRRNSRGQPTLRVGARVLPFGLRRHSSSTRPTLLFNPNSHNSWTKNWGMPDSGFRLVDPSLEPSERRQDKCLDRRAHLGLNLRRNGDLVGTLLPCCCSISPQSPSTCPYQFQNCPTPTRERLPTKASGNGRDGLGERRHSIGGIVFQTAADDPSSMVQTGNTVRGNDLSAVAWGRCGCKAAFV